MAAQTGKPGSMLELYRSALALRARGEPFAWRESSPGTLAFSRGELTCIVNFAAPELALDGELLLASDPGVRETLPPDTAAWVRTKGAR